MGTRGTGFGWLVTAIMLVVAATACGDTDDQGDAFPEATAAPTSVSEDTVASTSLEEATSTTLAESESIFADGWEVIGDIEAPGGGLTSVRFERSDSLGLLAVQTQLADSLYFEPGEDMFDSDKPSRFRSWVTPDGQRWASSEGWEYGWFNAVAATATRFVAAGVDEQAEAAVLWESTDGASWIRVPTSALPDLRACEPLDVSFTCLIAIRSNGSSLLIAGYDPAGELPDSSESFSRSDLPDCAWWLSLDDGTTWNRVEPPEDCAGLQPVSDGWVSVDKDGRLLVTADGIAWEERGNLPDAPSIWERADDGTILAASGGHWLATSHDDGHSWEVTDLPLEAQAAAVFDGHYLVVAASADGSFHILHRTEDDATWTDTPAGQTPLVNPADLEEFNGRLFAASYNGTIWQWTPPAPRVSPRRTGARSRD